MNSREKVLAHLATDHRVAGLTAGEALAGMSHSMSSLLLHRISTSSAAMRTTPVTKSPGLLGWTRMAWGRNHY